MNLRGITLAAALIALGATSQAASAGPATYNWSGAYVGGQLGYGGSSASSGAVHMYDDAEGLDEDGASPLPPFGLTGAGVIGGGEFGYNWQSGGMVMGVVTDLSGANIRGTHTDDAIGFSVDSTINWLGTARVNIGAPLGGMLVYGTGGIVVAGITDGLHDTYGDDVVNSSDSTTNIGWTIGAGLAAPLGSHWVVKAEYLYVDLGTKDLSFSEPDPGFPLITTTARTTANIVRASIDYRF
jgi:outer membrane immunogenic protein